MRRRVILVDDHELFRTGVRAELASAVEVVGEAGTVAETVPLIREQDPDVVLLDVHLPDGGGGGVIAGVAQERPGVKFLALSVSDAAEDVIGVIRAGARGYVTKTISAEELTEAVHRTADGDAVFSPRAISCSTSRSRAVSWSSSGSAVASPLRNASRTKPARRGEKTASPSAVRCTASVRSSAEIVFVT